MTVNNNKRNNKQYHDITKRTEIVTLTHGL